MSLGWCEKARWCHDNVLKQGKNVRQTLLNMAMGGAIYNLSRIIKKCQHFGHFIGCLCYAWNNIFKSMIKTIVNWLKITREITNLSFRKWPGLAPGLATLFVPIKFSFLVPVPVNWNSQSGAVPVPVNWNSQFRPRYRSRSGRNHVPVAYC